MTLAQQWRSLTVSQQIHAVACHTHGAEYICGHIKAPKKHPKPWSILFPFCFKRTA